MRGRLLVLLVLLGGCARPLAVHRQDLVLDQVAAQYRAFYPAAHDPDTGADVGLLRPRFGLPEIAQAGAPLTLELLERGVPDRPTPRAALAEPQVPDDDVARCLDGATVPGCTPLTLSRGEARSLQHGVVSTWSATPQAPVTPGSYDLYLDPRCDAPTRAPHAVWMRADDPATLPSVRVAHLSDIHIGKTRAELEDHLRQVIAEVNARRPDLVLITGDIVNQGLDRALPPRAQALLATIDAPVLAVLGNHDIGFRNFVGKRYGAGWQNFARAFHPYLEFEVMLGGYRFVGFDSGPSTLSPRILTRGLGPETIGYLGALLERSRRAGERGVVLFSHAPSRAALAGDPRESGGAFGHMRDGHREFERLLLDAATRGQRVLHLAGHTHWCDLYEAREPAPSSCDDAGCDSGLHFVHWREAELPTVLTPIRGRAALINTQAATHDGPWPKASGRGFGFAFLVLEGEGAAVEFVRHMPNGRRTRSR